MEAKEELVQFKKRFEPLLLDFVNRKRDLAKGLDQIYGEFVEILVDFVERGGKRLRPAFMYYGYLAAGGSELEKIDKAAVSVELLQAFLLIHDDIVDRSDLRRGKPSAHKCFEKIHTNLGLETNREHFGLSSAMILGDLTHTFAYDALLTSGFSEDKLLEARKWFDQLIMETAYGWYRELINTGTRETREGLILRAMEYVSARYTISGPLKLGATLAQADTATVLALEEYGLKLGTAFQIQDDILGMFGEEEKLGKPVESDMREGKKTLLLSLMNEKMTEEEKTKLWSFYGKETASRDDYEWLKGEMIKKGVLGEVKNRAEKMAAEAVGVLDRVQLKDEGKKFLVAIAEYIVKREV